MKVAKQRQRRLQSLRPRNPLALSPLLKKAGAHQRTDKRASRALQKATQRRRSRQNSE